MAMKTMRQMPVEKEIKKRSCAIDGSYDVVAGQRYLRSILKKNQSCCDHNKKKNQSCCDHNKTNQVLEIRVQILIVVCRDRLFPKRYFEPLKKTVGRQTHPSRPYYI
jgi:hypothetical protein